MHRIRQSRQLARLILALCLVWIGIAVASPAMARPALQTLCVGGVLTVAPGEPDTPQQVASHGLHCPLCVPALPPPPALFVARLLPAGPHPTAAVPAPPTVPQPRYALRIARGPPLLS